MWERSRPFALIVVLVAGVVVAVLTGTAKPVPAGQFALTGHWVFNSLLQTVFHIDGATGGIDAHAEVPGEPGSPVVQGDTSGYVVGRTGITQFDKATLSVQQTISPPAAEVPVGIEVVGGPYVVYRDAGKIVRLGDPPVVVSVGGAVGTPVVTTDGTMWVHRRDVGQICTLAKDAVEMSGCPVTAPPGHPGALTIVDERVAFVDTFSGALHMVEGDKLGPAVPIGVPISPNARPAANDLGGRVAILDPQRQSMLLADTRNPPGKPVTVALPTGDYDGPVSTGDVVVLVDRRSGTVLTYGADGVRKDSKPVKQGSGQPRLSRGEDRRVYVEDGDGTQVVVVGKDGDVRDVATAERPTATPPPPPPPAGQTPQQPDVRIAAPPPARPQAPRPPQRQEPTKARPQTPTPPAVPASRPGAPTSVAAQPGDATATVTWGAAPDNRAPITSYLVTWQGNNGRNGSLTVGGTLRRATVTGLTNGVRYVFTVAAINRVGTGPGVSSNPVQQSTRTVTVTRGTTESYNDTCKAPACGKMRVTLRGFEPNTKYKIVPFATSNYSNEGSSQTTDRNGNRTFEAFHFGKVGAVVWVVVDGQYQSNRYTWVSG